MINHPSLLRARTISTYCLLIIAFTGCDQRQPPAPVVPSTATNVADDPMPENDKQKDFETDIQVVFDRKKTASAGVEIFQAAKLVEDFMGRPQEFTLEELGELQLPSVDGKPVQLKAIAKFEVRFQRKDANQTRPPADTR